MARVALITSVRVSKKAVDRNRVKRIIREELRKYIAKFKPGDYVFIVKASATKVPAADLRAAVAKSLTVSKILQ